MQPGSLPNRGTDSAIQQESEFEQNNRPRLPNQIKSQWRLRQYFSNYTSQFQDRSNKDAGDNTPSKDILNSQAGCMNRCMVKIFTNCKELLSDQGFACAGKHDRLT